MFGMMPQGQQRQVHLDTAETVYISGLALLKMLKHGRAGIPLEVIGLMIGSWIDDYTVEVVDVFPTPQTATGQNVEAIDDTFQVQMTEMLKEVGRHENVVGWYHSHPGFGVWLSSLDLEQQRHWEQINPRCVAVVVDPVKSVRGKVVIGAFRTIRVDPSTFKPSKEPREITSFENSVFPKSMEAIRAGLNYSYYQMNISYRMSSYEETMLMSLNRPQWGRGFQIKSFDDTAKGDEKIVKDMSECIENYRKDILEEEKLTSKELEIRHVGKVDPKQFLRENASTLSSVESTQIFRLNLGVTTF